MHLTSKKGFTLVEALLATVIIAVALCGIMAAYVGCFGLLTTSKNVNIATNYAQGLMEQIRNTPFPQITSFTYNPTVPNMPQNSIVVYVDDTNPELLKVTISVCWMQNNRVIGEDQNLNGVLDPGEDTNGNGIIDSPVQLVTLVADR